MDRASAGSGPIRCRPSSPSKLWFSSSWSWLCSHAPPPVFGNLPVSRWFFPLAPSHFHLGAWVPILSYQDPREVVIQQGGEMGPSSALLFAFCPWRLEPGDWSILGSLQGWFEFLLATRVTVDNFASFLVNSCLEGSSVWYQLILKG